VELKRRFHSKTEKWGRRNEYSYCSVITTSISFWSFSESYSPIPNLSPPYSYSRQFYPTKMAESTFNLFHNFESSYRYFHFHASQNP